jgi:hypothetical protein
MGIYMCLHLLDTKSIPSLTIFTLGPLCAYVIRPENDTKMAHCDYGQYDQNLISDKRATVESDHYISSVFVFCGLSVRADNGTVSTE